MHSSIGAVLCRNVFILSSIAYTANLALTFHNRWAVHTTALGQYEVLASSAICSNPKLRMQSEQVNNCATAERIARGGALSPATLALLETLQRLALCAGEIDTSGRVQNRCDIVVESLMAASTKILVLMIVFGCFAVWMARQYCSVFSMRAAHLPLDVNDYPSQAHLPLWLRE
jgi:hypothetical protein